MLGNIKRFLSEAYLKFKVKAFGNNQPPIINYRYNTYYKHAKAKWHRPQEVSEQVKLDAKQFIDKGYVAFDDVVTSEFGQELKKKVDRLYEDQDKVYDVGYEVYRLIDGAEELHEIEEFFSGRIGDVIEQYFQSHFKIYNISIYRTLPNEQPEESSFLWHYDNAPQQELKLMIYFDDVSEDTGAFKFKDLDYSNMVKDKGFWHRKEYPKVKPYLDDQESTHVLEAKAGAAFLFQNGQIIHKATAPERLHRDVATIGIIPSDIPWRAHYARNRHLLSTNTGVCKNPWTDEPENIGYRY